MYGTVSARNISGSCAPNNGSANDSACVVPNEEGFMNPGHPLQYAYIFITTSLFGSILVMSLIGNGIVLFTVLCRKNMRSPCNYFIMNIALADLGVGVIAAPLRILELFASWPFGDFMCRFLWPMQDVFVCVSVVTHATIAFERYRAIVMPFTPKITLHKTKIFIVVIWLGCYITDGLPQSFLLKQIEIEGWAYCLIEWPSLQFRLCYVLYLVAVFILVPLVVQTWCYVRIVRVLKRKSKFGQSTRIVSRNADERCLRQKRKERLIRMLLTSLVVFQVCYIPRGVLMLITEFQSPEVLYSEAFAYADLVSLVLYYCKHIINPIILFAMSADFRDAFLAIVKCHKGDKSSRSQQDLTPLATPQIAMASV